MPGEQIKPFSEQAIEFERIYNKYSTKDVMAKMKISGQEYDNLLSYVIKLKRTKPILLNPFDRVNIPYSVNEDEYSFVGRKNMITKKGIVSFDGNEIKENFADSELSKAVTEYKIMCNLYNIKP